MKKRKKIFYAKAKTTKLNKIFFTWVKERKTNNEISLDLIKVLSEIKWGGGVVGLLDISSLSDLGPFAERKSDLIQREILSLRTEKNEKISAKNFVEALKLDEKENVARADLNKYFVHKVFNKHSCFYCFGENKIGFVFRGEKILDSTLEAEIRKVFPQMPVFSQVFFNYALNKINEESMQSNCDENCKIAA
jgi:hypothetical protein